MSDTHPVVKTALDADLIAAAFQAWPLLDGHVHPLEATLEEAVQEAGTKRWVLLRRMAAWCVDGQGLPVSGRADLIKVVGRLRVPLPDLYIANLVRLALRDESVLVREAAVTVGECWQHSKVVMDELRYHPEPEDWLQDHIDDLLEAWAPPMLSPEEP